MKMVQEKKKTKVFLSIALKSLFQKGLFDVV